MQHFRRGGMGRKRIAAERQRAAEPCAAALVLQGTQPRSIAQAPNFSNACNHAARRAGSAFVGEGGGDMTAVASPPQF